MALRDELLPVFDDVRQLMDELGLRKYDVIMRVITWSGDRPGVGAKTVVDTPLTIGGGRRVKVKLISSQAIIASAGKYAEGDYKVGPFTPTFAGGGVDPSYFDPIPTGAPTEIFYKLKGPGVPGTPGVEEGTWFKKIDQSTDGNFRYDFVLRAVGVDSP